MKVVEKWVCCAVLLAWACLPAAAGEAACRTLILTGQIDAGREWRAPIGQGWVLRLVPLTSGYTGWDLVVDRLPAAGYPDALLLASPPYGSINEREIGTSFGLRAQDAIGWNPRSFHFLTDPAALREAQQLLPLVASGARSVQAQQAAARLMALAGHAAFGQLRIEDARLTPGVADAKPYAEAWAGQAARMAHTEVPAPGGKATAQGALDWMRFSVTLWLPEGWKSPAGARSIAAPCQ